jgi:hypothetical protein
VEMDILQLLTTIFSGLLLPLVLWLLRDHIEFGRKLATMDAQLKSTNQFLSMILKRVFPDTAPYAPPEEHIFPGG